MCVCVCIPGCVYFTCSKEHNSDRSVEASPGANADRHQGHQEGKEDKEYSTQQQNQCGDLPVCIKSIHKNTTDQFHIVLHCMHYIHIIWTLRLNYPKMKIVIKSWPLPKVFYGFRRLGIKHHMDHFFKCFHVLFEARKLQSPFTVDRKQQQTEFRNSSFVLLKKQWIGIRMRGNTFISYH